MCFRMAGLYLSWYRKKPLAIRLGSVPVGVRWPRPKVFLSKPGLRTHAALSGLAPPAKSLRNLAMSLVGALPKKRLYSLLNCDALKYPTR